MRHPADPEPTKQRDARDRRVTRRRRARVGFDISSSSGIAFASAIIAGRSNLYTINLSTGLASGVGQIGSGNEQVTDIAVAPPTRLLNISTRARVGVGEDVMIAGFIAGGGGAPTRLLRACARPEPEPVRSRFSAPGPGARDLRQKRQLCRRERRLAHEPAGRDRRHRAGAGER
ncbi:MAG: DUF4394 domain-containing protein [Chthoniobacterales bacterium]|nr:DUF4394 domain-containing protein [Chthoniobacterales bacterium]